MLDTEHEILSFRAIAILPIVLFTPTLILGVLDSGSTLGSSLGILFHLSMLFVVSRMPAPAWAKAAGFGWLVLDVLCGAMLINAVPFDIAWPVRLGGHIFAGVWLITVSLLSASRVIRILGVVTGLWLAAYTFFGTVLPSILLAPPGILVIVWLGVLAWNYKETPTVGSDETRTLVSPLAQRGPLGAGPTRPKTNSSGQRELSEGDIPGTPREESAP